MSFEFLNYIVIPVGAIGLWRWSVWGIKRFAGTFYRPISNNYTCSATIVSPVFREDPVLFKQALESWFPNNPDRIITVIDVDDIECIKIARSFPKVEVILNDVAGKRAALVAGIDRVTTEIVVLVDSDVVWETDVLGKLKMPFADGKIGGVAPRAYMFPTQEDGATIWERLADIYLDLRYTTEVAGTTAWGSAVACLSGRTVAYRAEMLQGFREELLGETFLGKPCISGDDKRYTLLALRAGYKTWHQLNARVYSTFKPTLSGFTKQRLRWMRNSFRSDFRALFEGWIWRYPFLAFVLLDKNLAIITQLNGPAAFVLAIYYSKWAGTAWLAGWWLVSRAIKISSHLNRKPMDFAILPLYIVTTFYMTVIKYYACITMNKQGWLTRPVTLVDGAVTRIVT